MTSLFLFAVALAGGALNSVAGGGSFIGVPALIYTGVSPVAANATTTLAMWPGSLASAVAYRREVFVVRGWLKSLGLVSVIGGLLGGALLVRTSDSRFLSLLPWLMLAAVVTFSFGGPLTERLGLAPRIGPVEPRSGSVGPRTAVPALGTAHPAHRTAYPAPIWVLVLQFIIAIYGGYFGGGMGIMMLAAFSIAGMRDIHEMNAVKTVLAVAINGVALVEFVAGGVIAWEPGVSMVAGGIVGGYAGAAMARRVDEARVRPVIVVVGWLMTAYFFVR